MVETTNPIQGKNSAYNMGNVGIGGFIAATAIWYIFYPDDIVLLAGLGSYYVGCFGYFASWYLGSDSLLGALDERIDLGIGRVLLFLLLLVVSIGIPTIIVFDATGLLAVSSALVTLVPEQRLR